jgi:hypothetical protein
MAVRTELLAARTVITMGITSLANGSAWQSASIDNTANKYLDALVYVVTKGQAGSTLGLEFYVYAGDGGSAFTDAASGSDATFTAANRRQSALLDVLTLSTTTAVQGLLRRSVASCFGGVMPPKWGLIAINNTGGALSTTAGDHVITYQGYTETIV